VPGGPAGSYVVPPGIHKIRHVIVIQQEKRSFDSYFGTYPGADGIPMKNGKPATCVPGPLARYRTAPVLSPMASLVARPSWRMALR
jgi:Phosphoesterase family